MTTLNPGFTNRWTDSGDAATRFSKGKVSFGTPTVNWSYGVPLGGAPSALRARQHVAVRPCLKLRATRNKDVVAVMIQYSVFSIQNSWMGLDWLIDFETTKYGRACNGQEWDGSFSLFVFRPPIQAKTLHVEEFKIQMRSVWSPSSKILTLLHSSSFSTTLLILHVLYGISMTSKGEQTSCEPTNQQMQLVQCNDRWQEEEKRSRYGSHQHRQLFSIFDLNLSKDLANQIRSSEATPFLCNWNAEEHTGPYVHCTCTGTVNEWAGYCIRLHGDGNIVILHV